MSVNDLDLFMAEIGAVRTPRTTAVYRVTVERFVTFLHRKKITSNRSIPETILIAWVTEDLSKQLKPASVRKYVAGATLYLQWLKRHGRIDMTPTRPMVPRLRQVLRTILRGELLAGFVKRARSIPEPHQTMQLLMIASGLRASEVCALKRTDIHVVNRETIRETWIIVRGEKGHGNQKSQADRRVPLLPSAAKVLGAYLVNARPKLGPGPYVFPNGYRNGSHVVLRTVESWTEKIAHHMGLDFSPHDLRHTALTWFAEQGIEAPILQAIAGHEKLATTQRYIHMSPAAIYAGSVGKIGDQPWLK